MTNDEWIELVNGAARARDKPTLPRETVLEAVDRCLNGIAKVDSYPGGFPSLKAVYDVAKGLQ